jgi:acyl carrier protein
MMDRKEIESIVNNFLTEEMEIDADVIEDDATLKENLGLDSLDFVDIVVIVEKTFGFKIKPEEMANVLTVKDFYDYIETNIVIQNTLLYIGCDCSKNVFI